MLPPCPQIKGQLGLNVNIQMVLTFRDMVVCGGNTFGSTGTSTFQARDVFAPTFYLPGNMLMRTKYGV